MDRTIRIIFAFIFIIVFYVISWLFIKIQYGDFFTFVIHPLFWLLMAIYARLFIYTSNYHLYEYRKYLLNLFVTAGLAYVVISFGLGILVSGFANNIYDTSIVGMLYNFWTIGTVMILGEIVRSSIMNSKTKIDKTVLKFFVVIIFVLMSFNYLSLSTQLSDIYGIFKFVGSVLIPAIIVNAVLTTTVSKGGALPGILYQMIIYIALWAAPIVPAHKWVVLSLLALLIPFFTFLVYDNKIKAKELHLSSRIVGKYDPKSWIFRFAIIVGVLLFFLGVTPIYPLNILTDSMYPKIHAGDVVIIQKTTIDKVEVGDIIQYQRDSYTVVHRVIKISEKGGIIFINTKGDNNKDMDTTQITYKNFIGKVIFTVPKVGLPNIWLKDTLNQIDQSKSDSN